MTESKIVKINSDSEFLNLPDAAVFLGIAEQTLYTWGMQKRLPYYKVGRLNKYRKNDLVAFIEKGKVE